MSFKPVDSRANFVSQEEETLKFWDKQKIFKKGLKLRENAKRYVFFEGPPSANGRPGVHHVLARAFKDLWPRYKTMQGYLVERKAGWDTHGLPVEIGVEKQLKLKNKGDIEKFGVEEFNKKARESVWEFKEDWEKLTERMAFWVDMDNPYITYDPKYIESLWWIIKEIHKKDLLYEGYKVTPRCTRCGTSLSSHEVAQGYKEVNETSLYVKFRIKNEELRMKNGGDTYILSWTTTPWTLPGNVGLAVGEKIKYVEVRVISGYDNGKIVGYENLILAKDIYEVAKKDNKHPLFEAFSDEYAGVIPEGESAPKAHNVINIAGKDLVGIEYEPLFDGAVPKSSENYENAFKVIGADFVTTEDGTGVVHTAVMYGVDDYELGEKVGLPKVHTVDEAGKFLPSVKKWAGKYVKNKEVEKEIVADLEKRNLLLKEMSYKHDYPHCWRCDTPLLYYAAHSWFIGMSQLRDKLIKNNQDINWTPEHLKEGRFGEWLNDVKDWAFSRERYWGTPLPIWKCVECDNNKVIGSYDELKESNTQLTKILFVRHGESEKNVIDLNSNTVDKWPLTKNGKADVEKFASKMDEKIDIIISSPILRAKETAEIIKKSTNAEITLDELLSELDFGKWNEVSDDNLLKNKAYLEYKNIKDRGDYRGRYEFKLGETGESRVDIVSRLNKFLKKIFKKYAGKTVLIVAHGATHAALHTVINNSGHKEYFANEWIGHNNLKTFYLGSDGKSFDPHKPFIDKVELDCQKCKGKMKRVSEIIDVWFDSGAMPFAQWHYPFENKEKIDNNEAYPAEFISEAVDQTRGWFYTLLAVATLLGKKAPYKNVISLGHIMDKHGKKMSKSKGNIVDPWHIFDTYGSDALRWYLYSMNQPGVSKNFDEDGVKQVVRRFMLTLWNTYSFFVTYANIDKFDVVKVGKLKPTNVLDQWIWARRNQLVDEVSAHLDKYEPMQATQKIEEFIDDLSNWYVRRSRRRFWKGEMDADKELGYITLYNVLLDLSKLMAPFMPFLSEGMYSNLRTDKDPESVHLASWPEAEKVDEEILKSMKTLREVVETGLSQREDAGIKVRQPLSSYEINTKDLSKAFIEIIVDELNVKEVKIGKKTKLNTKITPELAIEGVAREIVRSIQILRKQNGLAIEDRIKIGWQSEDKDIQKAFEIHTKYIKTETLADELSEKDEGEEVKVNGSVVKLLIEK